MDNMTFLQVGVKKEGILYKQVQVQQSQEECGVYV